MTEAAAWERARLALQLLALDPFGLGGVVVRMRASPQRDALLRAFDPGMAQKKLPLSISDEQLFGGIDLAATIAAGKPVRTRGFFSQPLSVMLPMAERCTPELAAKLLQVRDNGQQFCLICIDEGAEPEEGCPPALSERLAFHIALSGRLPQGFDAPLPTDCPPAAEIREAEIEALVSLAASFGIDSLRAPLLAILAARAHARLRGRTEVERADVEAAAALVYPQRARHLPEDTAERSEPDDHPSEPHASEASASTTLPDEMLVDAVRALLPDHILDRLVPAGTRSASGTGSGATGKGNRRGRPLPPRIGRPADMNRIDLVSTLRAAAPWQAVRRENAPVTRPIYLRPSDVRLKAYQNNSDRLLIFTVDASGSAAVARLGEAKGAVELLLAQAYSKRDQVALVSFRGTDAEILLPPTRSLVQTRRRLSALPGGGGTPLARGLQEAGQLAHLAKGQGLSPTLIVLTDGRANIALDGRANRPAAKSDAEAMSRCIRARGTPGLVIDTGRRPSTDLQSLSAVMGGSYIALPRADAHSLSRSVTAALGT